MSAPRDDQAQDLQQSVAEIEETKTRMHASARAMMGIGGDEPAASFRQMLAESGTTVYPLAALSLLLVADQLQTQAFLILGPEISKALGLSRSTLGGLISVKTLILSLATFPMARLVQARPRRASLSIATALLWSGVTAGTGIAVTVWGLFAAVAGGGVSTGSVSALHAPLLIDSYPPSIRVRVLGMYQTAQRGGEIAAPLMVLLCTGYFGLTWRGVFLVMGLLCSAAAVFALRLRDPGFGTFDAERVRSAVRAGSKDSSGAEPAREDLGFFEITQRLMLIPTMRSLLMASAALGMMLIPLGTYAFFYLQERWGLGPSGRAAVSAVLPVFAVIGLAIYNRRGEVIFRRSAARFLHIAAGSLGAAGVLILLIVHAPTLWLFIVATGVFGACLTIAFTVTETVRLSIIPPEMRPHAAALSGVFLAGVGGFAGLTLMRGFDTRFGTGAAISIAALPAFAAVLFVLAAARRVDEDFDRMVDEIVEEEEIRTLHRAGAQLPLLSCRQVEFCHGQVQTLFDVDLSVREGEMVALLGTNGAGKTTLLRIISGLALPQRGTVRLDGNDITYVSAERRVAMGIAQIAGGSATFPNMTVIENLRVFATTAPRSRRSRSQTIEACFDIFPALEVHRDDPASLLSGGQQQMLALSKALLLRPRLLLIDELSLGLAPIVVAQLLEMVRAINAEGTALILVEQSVNVALTLVERAYFMEKGAIRFDGAANELLQREDLLRSVFLEGADAARNR